jgi:uncharacterized SAM-binding protein YcdF (DUF218 family)
MPPLRSRPGGKSRRRLWLLVVVSVAAAFGTWLWVSLGRLLYHEDPLQHADVIFVLAGSWLERVAEAGDLYREGRAPLVVLSREMPDPSEQILRARGFDVPSISDMHIKTLQALGVPREAIFVVEPQVATASEAATLRQLALERGWRHVIVVTSRFHTARSRLVFRRRLDDVGVQIIMRASRYDNSPLDAWWKDRVSFRFVIFEAEKFVAYWFGLLD